jgi:hypothetical protein
MAWVRGCFSLCSNLVPRACDPWEGNEGSGIIRCRKPGILAKIELRIHFNGQSDSSLKRIIPEPSFPSQGSQARGTRLTLFHLPNWRYVIWPASSPAREKHAWAGTGRNVGSQTPPTYWSLGTRLSFDQFLQLFLFGYFFINLIRVNR